MYHVYARDAVTFRTPCITLVLFFVVSFPVVDWFCPFVNLWVLPFPLEDCSVFGNFVITLIRICSIYFTCLDRDIHYDLHLKLMICYLVLLCGVPLLWCPIQFLLKKKAMFFVLTWQVPYMSVGHTDSFGAPVLTDRSS